MDVNEIAMRAEEHRIIYECAIKMRALINEVIQEIGDTGLSGDCTEELIKELVFD